jgi:hypothetical protein
VKCFKGWKLYLLKIDFYFTSDMLDLDGPSASSVPWELSIKMV